MTTKVLVIEDSALMRKHLRRILEEGGFQVETARNGQEGLDKIPKYDPDVVTLDINMPVMDGLTCLSLIMNQCPKPVVMVSSLTEKGALVTFEALELGAVDYVPKPGGTVSLNMDQSADLLIAKVSAAAKTRVQSGGKLKARLRSQRERAEVSANKKSAFGLSKRRKSQLELVVIGVSTGGPGTLQDILTCIPADYPLPIVVAQHMPGRFTEVFAKRLDKICPLNIVEVDRPMQLVPGKVYIAKGDADAKIIRRGTKKMVTHALPDHEHLWHPSVHHLVLSAVEVYTPPKLLLVQLTGMGNDGAKVMAEANKKGAQTIAESEETAVVFGMPRELIELDGADYILPCHKIADAIVAAAQ